MKKGVFQWGQFYPRHLCTPYILPSIQWMQQTKPTMTYRAHYDVELKAHKQGFTHFVAKRKKLPFTRFWGKILNSNFHPCKTFDISQVWSNLRQIYTYCFVWCFFLINNCCNLLERKRRMKKRQTRLHVTSSISYSYIGQICKSLTWQSKISLTRKWTKKAIIFN